MQLRVRSGWSLLELAIVVSVIAILAALAVPLYHILLKKSRFTSFANDLRVHAQAIERYAAEKGDYPPTYTTSGSYIPGLEGYLSPAWLEGGPAGGVYTWYLLNPTNPAASEGYIQVEPTVAHPYAFVLSDIVELDEDIDDGNLATGRLQLAGMRIRFIVKEIGR